MTFAHRLEGFGDLPALVEASGRRMSYAELASRCDALGARLGPDRSVVAVSATNTIEAVSCYLATLRAGHVALLIDEGLGPQDFELLRERYRLGWHFRPDGAQNYELSQLTSRTRESVHPDLAVLLSTSGSTGSPKLVRLTLANVDSNAASIADYLQLGPGERPVSSLPFSYSYGLSVLNSHLRTGGCLLLTREPVTGRAFWDFFRAQQATSFAGVPFLYSILRRLRFERMDLPSLRYMTQAGGRLDPDNVRFFAKACQERSCRFFVMYGQTEATARISYLPPQLAHGNSGSIGLAIPGGRLSVVDDRGVEVTSPRVAGELVYHGPNVMLGYAESFEDLQLGDVQRGTLRTGDLGYFDEQGLFYVTGRLKRFIKLFGNRVSLDEVEGQLRRAGHECAVTGRDGLLVVATEQADEPAIGAFIAERFRFHHSAVRVARVSVIPKSPGGKPLYAELLRECGVEDAGAEPGQADDSRAV
ncbi:MAG: AMP-binding protein [Candidatus Wallbacteria bacterium]|nr:AMP-binding protein [Candidatus Wallbacteria bacterium]